MEPARLRAWVREEFGVDLTSVEQVTAGGLWVGAEADDTPYAVRWGGGGPGGLLLAAELAEQGVLGVLPPVLTAAGDLWTERDGRRLWLVPWIDGVPALEGRMRHRHWVAYGELLAQAHATVATGALAEHLRVRAPMHERLAAAARDLDGRLGGAGAGGDTLVHDLAGDWRDGAGARVRDLAERAQALGAAPGGRDPGAVPCHGDPHLGNVLVDGDDGLWLVDWDGAALAPREHDLVAVAGGGVLLPDAPVTPEQERWFFEGYGRRELDTERLAYERCVRALGDAMRFAGQVLDAGGRAVEGRAQALDAMRAVLSPSGLAGLALA